MYLELIEVALSQLVADETREVEELKRIGPLHDDLRYFIEKCDAPGLSAMPVDLVCGVVTITAGFLSYRVARDKGKERVIIAPRSPEDAAYVLKNLHGAKIIQEGDSERASSDVCNIVFFAEALVDEEYEVFRSMVVDLYGGIRLRSGGYSEARSFILTHNSSCCEYVSKGPLEGYDTFKRIMIAMRAFSANVCKIRSYQGKPLPGAT